MIGGEMAFSDFPAQSEGVGLLQRSLECSRLPHACLFSGDDLDTLEGLSRTLAKTLNCLKPILKNGAKVDCCDQCSSCLRIDSGNHGDVHWVRPESKSRLIIVDQLREVIHEANLKPSESEYKVFIILAADRMNEKAANAFLKTLEEPPPKSILILATIEPQRLLETILSRCQKLKFGGEGMTRYRGTPREWLAEFGRIAAAGKTGLLARYRLMDVLLKVLSERKETIEKDLTERSPLERYKDVEKDLAEKWEDELKASIESEYRRQRSNLLGLLQWWMRDIWLCTLGPSLSSTPQPRGSESNGGLLSFPEITETRQVAARISSREALSNLQILEQVQRWLHTNVQEALALEVCLLKLKL
jgi:DNA polymerase-3 subunit delta'